MLGKASKLNIDVLLNGYVLTVVERSEELGFPCHPAGEERVFISLDSLISFIRQELHEHPKN